MKVPTLEEIDQQLAAIDAVMPGASADVVRHERRLAELSARMAKLQDDEAKKGALFTSIDANATRLRRIYFVGAEHNPYNAEKDKQMRALWLEGEPIRAALAKATARRDALRGQWHQLNVWKSSKTGTSMLPSRTRTDEERTQSLRKLLAG